MLSVTKFVILLSCLFCIRLSAHELLRKISVPVDLITPNSPEKPPLVYNSMCSDEPLLINFTFSEEVSEELKFIGYKVLRNERLLFRASSDRQRTRYVTVQASYGNDTQDYSVDYECTDDLSLHVRRTGKLWSSTIRLHFYECTKESPREIRKRHGQTAVLPCLQAFDDHLIQWELDQQLLPNTTYALQFPKVNLSDFGTYKCLAKKNDSFEAYSATYHLIVIPDKVSNFRVVNVTDTTAIVIWDPKVKITNRVGMIHEVEIEKYIRVQLNSFDSLDRPSRYGLVNWTNLEDQNQILLTDLIPDSFHRIGLSVRLPQKGAEGQPKPYSTRLFFVTAPPNDTIADPVVIRGNLGDPIELSCVPEFVHGLYYVSWIDWSRSPHNISHAERLQRSVKGGSIFKIDTLLRHDLGTYECRVVFNKRFTITNETEDFRRKIILALNDDESGENELQAPTDLRCTNVTETSLLVKWMPNQTSEHKVRYWIRGVHYEENGQKLVEKSVNETVLENLRPETVYGIELVATNQTRESEPAKIYCLTESIFDEALKFGD